MRPHKLILIFVFLLCPLLLPAEKPTSTLENILLSLGKGSNTIEARKSYNNALVEQKYSSLQWWRPSLSLSNNLIYPYKHDEFDDLATSNTTSLTFSAPLPTGTQLELSASYSLNRNIFTDMFLLEKWGFSQDLQGKIGIAQSLNPWWLYISKNPYTTGVMIKSDIAKGDYNTVIKSALFSGIRSYISLRQSERNRDMLIERLSLYDDMLTAYRQMRDDGSISWREFQNIRKDKWEDEEALFSLEQDINTLRAELYQLTGIHVDNISLEELATLDNSIWSMPFLNLPMEDICWLEEKNIQYQKENLRTERLISRQGNAPFLKFEFGTLFKLPVEETGSLGDAWKKNNFTDNILNNWSLTISVDLSSLFSPLNKKNEESYWIFQNSLDKLLDNIYLIKEEEKIRMNLVIKQLKDHIVRLADIIRDEENNLISDKKMFERGALTELEYRQSLLEYKSKCILLENFSDNLWLYQVIVSFF